MSINIYTYVYIFLSSNEKKDNENGRYSSTIVQRVNLKLTYGFSKEVFNTVI